MNRSVHVLKYFYHILPYTSSVETVEDKMSKHRKSHTVPVTVSGKSQYHPAIAINLMSAKLRRSKIKAEGIILESKSD